MQGKYSVAKNMVHTNEDQMNIFMGLQQEMLAQGQLIGIPQIPGAIDPATGTTPPPAASATPKAKPAVPNKMTDQSVTAGVANQGQLIPIAPPQVPGSSVTDDISDLKRIIGQAAGQQQNPAAAPAKDSGGGGDILGTIVDVGLSFIGWIICTELMRQGKMPRKWWIKGAPVFAAYPNFVKQGYYLWARPCVDHLRRRPDSWFSHVLCVVFNARAKSIAEKRTLSGVAVTVILWPICWALGAALWLAGREIDWTSVYKEQN